MSDIIVDCQNLDQYFDEGNGRVDIFQNINLQIKKGERLAIVGASGSGKSTLLYMMGGLDTIKAGKLLIDGQDISQLNARKLGQLRNKTLGFVYQFHHLLPEFSALENVAMPLLIRGDNTSQAKEKAAYLLEQVGLSNRVTHKPGELSGGERQRAAIARALVTNPKCLLADEPTGNLDNTTARQVYDLLIKLNEEMSISLVLVTHDEKLAARMDKVLMLSDGHLTDINL
ncbi:MAG: lipoprotein-releasing ABC transporter ATP-binding protein LolD [gamma proteobacterium symbiont of Bathyaustriella thionipta]|nr:lipoprotein-releasing ABC transporter ATP-binding protein LolD [gamma proteobacterium symbiont of Bathyaustriella thionipta]MCU7950463.1 lipoprotein-releasing ABC transporter ATP-binding protein LolD [gamma proteobacterium symbiont of Bathyaustriella thionipta]MCU7953271.1 lipoprotein-releasing ABC transporter ATP-binding protein LolD [gamma proteobacterium symbiont of Bathyaustriella thionipta]MCU7957253.1 lipoprotein-releasing ABC transporter ATP-binding protein LolD [gamma proteobacterium 